MSRATLAAVLTNAKASATALTAMTDTQRQVLLALPAVALAHNVATDCQAEFDNHQVWQRWAARATAVPRDMPLHDNDNEPLPSASTPSRPT